MEFRLLGDLRVTDDAGRTVVLPARQRLFLAILLCHAGTPVSADRLIAEVWSGEPPRTAAKSVHVAVHRLRRGLGEGRLTSSAAGYTLHVRPEEVDAARFERLAAEARASGGIELYRRALETWRGRPFDGVGHAPCVAAEAGRLEERRLAVLQARLEAELAAGGHADLVGELARLAAEHPLRERFHALLMLALHRAGRPAEALAAYREARRGLVAELGVEPGEELSTLHDRILHADPALALPRERILHADPALALPRERTLGGDPALGAEAGGAFTLPTDISDFAGRAELVERACAALRRRGSAVPVVAISGPGGAGKTTLAVHVAHRMREHYPDGRLYLRLTADAEPGATLARVLRGLGVFGQELPETFEERAELYRRRLAGRRVLVVVDNAATEAQVVPLLPGEPGCGVIVTSRARLGALAGAEPVEVGELTEEQSLGLLARIAGSTRVDAEPGAARELTRLCGRLPLALRICGARLAARPHWSVELLVGRLRDERRRLDELTYGDLAVRAVLTFSHQRLGPDEARLLRLLSLLEAPDFPAWAAAALMDRPVAAAEPLVEELVDARLLEVAGTDAAGQLRYRFHDLVRLCAREFAEREESPEERAAAVERAMGAWLAIVNAADRGQFGQGTERRSGAVPWSPGEEFERRVADHSHAWLEAERTAILAAVRQSAGAGLAGHCWELATYARCLWKCCGYREEMREAHGTALLAAERAGDGRGQAMAHHGLAEWARLVGRPEAGREHLEAATLLFERLGDTRGLAVTLHHRGIYLHRTGRPAGPTLLRALELARESGDGRSQALILRSLTSLRLAEGDPAGAEPYALEALRVCRDRPLGRLETEMVFNRGVVRMALGELDAAEADLGQAYERVRGTDPDGEAQVGYNLAGLLHRRGRHGEALGLLDGAEVFARRARDGGMLARLLRARALNCRALGREADAVAAEAEADEIDARLPA
ncbi:AfsR/SARP family transcriptional regulator [Nonomuraea sp. NPDC050663]|uniref:AfsR/SARP family transcriptional regulator n=1 Tax=Nonomuraea sp. NPDC050663 TaxID=3364370 RepID=UPI00379BC7F8